MMVRYGQIDKAPPVREWIDPAYLRTRGAGLAPRCSRT